MRGLECGATSRLPFVHSLFAWPGVTSEAFIILLKDTLRWCLVIVPSRFLPKIEERHSLALASELSFHLSYIFAALLFASSGVILIKC
jgi:hypothetical protein